VISEQPFHDRPQIGRGFQIAALVEVGVFEPGPIGNDAAALQRAAGEHGDARSSMVRAAVAIDVCGAAELGDGDDNRVLPRIAEIGCDRRQRVVERCQQIGEPALKRTFIDMRIPAIEGERPDAWPIGLGEKLGRCTRGTPALSSTATAQIDLTRSSSA